MYHKKRFSDIGLRSHLKATPPGNHSEALEASYSASQKRLEPQAHFRMFSGRVYPNGEFGVGRIPFEKKSAEDRRQEKGEICDGKRVLIGRHHELEDGTVLHDTTDMIEVIRPNKLGSAHKLSQTKKYGLKGITSAGRKICRNVAYMMERDKGRNTLVMGTLTIPKFDDLSMKLVCSNWAYLTKRFFEECKRRYERFRRPWRYVSVTEIQPKRWRKYGDVGLHIHFLCTSYWIGLDGCYTLDDNWVRSTWRRLLENLFISRDPYGEMPEEFPTPNYRREDVRSSAAAYIAKYMSKGSEIVKEVVDTLGEEFIPSQWWSADTKSKKQLVKETIYTRSVCAEFLIFVASNQLDYYCVHANPIEIDTPSNGSRIVGYFGRLTQSGINVCKELATQT